MEQQAPEDAAWLGGAGAGRALSGAGRDSGGLLLPCTYVRVDLFLKAENQLFPSRAASPRGPLRCSVRGTLKAGTTRPLTPLLPVPRAEQQPDAHGGWHPPSARPSPPRDRAPCGAGDTGSPPRAGHRALASGSAQTPRFGILNLACSFSTGIFRVLHVPEAARRARSRASSSGARPALLPPAGPGCSAAGPRRRCPDLGRSSLLRPRAGTPALSQPGSGDASPRSHSVPSPLPSCSQLPLPARMEQSRLFSRRAARTSYSHQRHRLGRSSSSWPRGCGETGASSFHALLGLLCCHLSQCHQPRRRGLFS